MSIKRKLTLMMVGICLGAVIATVLAITSYLIYDMRSSTAHQLSVTATLTGDRNAASLLFLDNARAQSNLEIFRLDPAIMAACIYDRQGALFASYVTETPSPQMHACPDAAQAVPMSIPEMLIASQDIRQNGEAVGSVFILSDTSEIDSYVHRILLISGTVTLLVFMVTLPLTAYLQRTISEPILELTATAELISEIKDYTLAAKSTYEGETGTLARAFNTMLGEVRKRDDELRRANETLEYKVVERTRQLEVSKRKAEAANEAKTEFLRNMSHEFRTPLHAITSFSVYGAKEYETAPREQLKQYFTLIQKGTERLSRLVGEVLDLARMENGHAQLSLQMIDMHEVVDRAAEIMQPLLREKNLSLHFDWAADPLVVDCDADKMIQVVTNLLGNAVKFTPAGRQITVHAHSSMADGAAQVMVSVIDEGIGIPEGENETIFESFRQSSRTNTGAGGTGLGLAICRGIVEMHGGMIWAENTAQGQGACITFRLPAATGKTKVYARG